MTEAKLDVELDYIAAGGNRHPSAADWSPGLLAFGAGNNIALWDPENARYDGISALLSGHTDHVNSVKIYDDASSGQRYILSGGMDKAIRIWTTTNQAYPPFEQKWCIQEHQGSINTISILPQRGLFVTGSADGTVKVWHLMHEGARLIQSISLKPRYLPLTAALASLYDSTVVLAVAGTSSAIQLFFLAAEDGEFVLQATLTGHESWIRSLDFVNDAEDLLLASGSQDRYIRLWRFRKGSISVHPTVNGSADAVAAAVKKSLSNKTYQVGREDSKYHVSFEALLIGHEDWVYTARWAPTNKKPSALTLLTASADNSLAIWQADEASGVWICNTRLGEISAQKGSTTATGSTGGFWTGLWQPDAKSVVSLGRTGSWRRWVYEEASDIWKQKIGLSGHIKEVRSLAWAPDGSYLLTTSSDQTTRLLAEWKREENRSWHEFSRPQIHGYDLNCIDSLSINQFISGADEKLLRVFNKPKAVHNLLSKLSGIGGAVDGELADAANIPVLGLSNKAIAAVADEEPTPMNAGVNSGTDEREAVDPASVIHRSTLDLGHPPLEDHLARHTLWPEHEKLYGHGYEISAVAASHDGSLVATACKASSIDHAAIRIYDTKEWREARRSLIAHSLTVTSLAFSADDQFLLSVGRDRQWAIFKRDAEDVTAFTMVTSNPKGHARMILDCSWTPVSLGYVFATAGRDKVVKLWRLENGKAETINTISAKLPVTAVAFALGTHGDCGVRLAFGTEDGSVQISSLDGKSLQPISMAPVASGLNPSSAVNRICWRPQVKERIQFAVASDDGSVRICNVKD